jgi:uncharacterized protein
MTILEEMVHKVEAIKRIERIFESGKYNRQKILVDHNLEETIEKTTDLGLWAGLSAYPYTNLSPERVMNIIKKYGANRIMIHSAADWGVSDPLSVQLVAREMRERRIDCW